MEKLLPLGSVVMLENGEQKLMITSRVPLYNNEGTIGYFDYGGCLYPNGHVDQQMFFFNASDIAEVYFEGYVDDSELEFQERYKEEIKKVQYPKLLLVDEEN
ncbi:DUF4176 domain-containing protein [Pueribacillus sp. YX66]|uniref:DUF4176 domain-containing protein n=1 Tax=Pueribacillus sp. YX66 TaxID=3229242 RepID=UPI00358D9996